MIYFDHSATTPLDAEVLSKMQPFFDDRFGNASSLHSYGQEAKAALEGARMEVANVLNANASEIIFTSGGTESDNLAIKGLAFALMAKGLARPMHIITSKIEHHAILHTVEQLEKIFGFEATYLDVDHEGLVDPEDVRKAIKDNTILVSVMYANNEIGTVEPIPEIGAVVEAEKAKRKEGKSDYPVYFHTDAVQVASYLDLDVNELKVDMMSLSGHKFYGPKGVGVLYVRKGVKLEPVQTGGGHERKLRSGTENVPGIVGFAAALKKAEDEKAANAAKVGELRDYLIKSLPEKLPGVILTGHPEKRLPSIASFLIDRIEGESMLIKLDLAGIAVSTGSACSSGSLEASHVLKALDFPAEKIHGSLRISLGKENTREEIDKFLDVFPPIAEGLREISVL